MKQKHKFAVVSLKHDNLSCFIETVDEVMEYVRLDAGEYFIVKDLTKVILPKNSWSQRKLREALES